jgi:hypothetical protein
MKGYLDLSAFISRYNDMMEFNIQLGTFPPKFSAQKASQKSRKNLGNEKYLPWKPKEHWWDPYELFFEDCSIDGAMENIIFTTKEKIYSINWTFWSMDFCWRSRIKPEGVKNVDAKLNRKMEIYLYDNKNLYLQTLLPPQNNYPEPKGSEVFFSHSNKWLMFDM